MKDGKPETHGEVWALEVAAIAKEVGDETFRAMKSWPQMNSAHEAYAVLLEEVEELKAHVFTKQSQRDMPAMRREAIQVAAMAVRLVRDIIDKNRGHR